MDNMVMTNIINDEMLLKITLNVVRAASDKKNFKILKMLPTEIPNVMKELNLTKVPVYTHIRGLEKHGLLKWHAGTGKIYPTDLTESFMNVYQVVYKYVEENLKITVGEKGIKPMMKTVD